jgi:hypothetical protein
VNSIRLNIAEAAAPSTACKSRPGSPESDRREQQERDCTEVEGDPIDFDESDSFPPARVWQQSPPTPPIEQWLSPFAPICGIRHPERQFSPPHHSKMKMAKWSRTILFIAFQSKRIAGNCKRLVFWKSSMAKKIPLRI